MDNSMNLKCVCVYCCVKIFMWMNVWLFKIYLFAHKSGTPPPYRSYIYKLQCGSLIRTRINHPRSAWLVRLPRRFTSSGKRIPSQEPGNQRIRRRIPFWKTNVSTEYTSRTIIRRTVALALYHIRLLIVYSLPYMV